MTEIIDLRNTLMTELNAGYFDLDSWSALAIMARDANCLAIEYQVNRYIEHYSLLKYDKKSCMMITGG